MCARIYSHLPQVSVSCSAGCCSSCSAPHPCPHPQEEVGRGLVRCHPGAEAHLSWLHCATEKDLRFKTPVVSNKVFLVIISSDCYREHSWTESQFTYYLFYNFTAPFGTSPMENYSCMHTPTQRTLTCPSGCTVSSGSNIKTLKKKI